MEATLASPRARRSTWRFTFLIKPLALAALIALADRLFYPADAVGATLGIFVLALLLSAVALRPDLRRSRPALVAAAAAGWFGFWLVDDPGPLGLALAWVALTMAVLLPKAAQFGNGLRWALRLFLHGLATPLRPIQDLSRLARVRRRRPGRINIWSLSSTLVLPILGTGLFLTLFAAANPLIESTLTGLDPLSFLRFSPLRTIFWGFIGLVTWRLLSPRLMLRGPAFQSGIDWLDLPGISTASVTISLVAFNALFALQNGLDLAFLWSGAALPEGMTLAQYAHRGAYPLIGTALLAAAFVLVTTRPGTAMGGNRLIRRLVYFWIAQNLFLVASTMLRTIDYIEAYLLTELRIEALIWMALVAVGLVLICVRLARGRSSIWLINANMAAAALVLGASAAIDYDRIAAGWNVRHAREVGGRGSPIDLCYLSQMTDSALLPLIELESRPLPPELRGRVSWLRNLVTQRLEARQAHWQGWDWRGARRLAAAREQVAALRLPRFPADLDRQCDGWPHRRIEVAPPAPAQPLTAAKGR
ncbi:MAG TPA: DUF4173 domain-containing protein [Allosphingosinicella sp.]|jgi:hypothetical protein|uniref:DUF4153 domain-containing protein n=1 Tax=Allosphingosinicella sp. TaxID=2823234 RepID=UPI002F27F894